MIKHNQNGAVNGVVMMLSLSALAVIFLVFGIWAFSGRQHYKNNAQTLINAAVAKAQTQQTAADNAKFTQEEQDPLNTYNGPEAFGSLIIKYPKTWSGYIESSGNSGNSSSFAAYFNPGTVPSVSDQSSNIALSVQVLNQAYASVTNGFQGQPGVTASAFSLKNVPQTTGVEVSGPIGPNQTDQTMVVLPLRSNTLEIATDGTQNLSTFNSIILPNLSFSP